MLSIEVVNENRIGGVVVHLRGAGTADEAPALRAGLAGLEARRPRGVIFDCSGLEIAGSSAIGALVEVRKMLRAFGGRCAVAAASEYVARSFRLSRLDSAFEMHPTLEDALAALAVKG
ncbi:MAG: STAS domain-containing protein [Phycisphaerales bacterium]|nr:STAS domain-containing protein [Phycisphaerales bacterium]